MRLRGKVAVVTGGAQGIGEAIGLTFAQEGADVVVADILGSKARDVAEKIQSTGRKSFSFGLDVSKADHVGTMVEGTLEAFGRIDILANAAGSFIRSPIEAVSEEDWDRVINVNLKGTFLCCQAIGNVMLRQEGGGSIVNIASIAGHTPQIYLGAYSPSKAAVLLLTKIMAVEWAGRNIRVNAISPGPTATPMFNAIYENETQLNRRKRAIPMNRFASPEEMARAALFLASDDAAFMTGETLVIDGGSLNSMYYLMSLLSSSE
jgi:NAD(P)-dependent dehydrogenase (short-subunit alcohol dehydrogenase family)